MHRVIKFGLVLTFILTSAVARPSGGSIGAAGARGGGTRGLSFGKGGASGGSSNTVRPVRPGRSSGTSIDLGLWHYFTSAYLVYAFF
ncbi:hypothetical protein SASPL_146641 [Salvia splendens]|uniref:Uncharacterized protein n=1 Tax=Salvia splendens TaxID=180675 RepID=A0A8X8WCH7_SALSN|nr:hypothetical protein SASPL_146641 [Salvia splendens]